MQQPSDVRRVHRMRASIANGREWEEKTHKKVFFYAFQDEKKKKLPPKICCTNKNANLHEIAVTKVNIRLWMR